MLARILVLLVLSGFSGSSYALPRQIHFTNLSVQDGLRSGAVGTICQDQQGVIWMAVREGVHSFDGYELRSFGRPPGDRATVTCVAPGHRGQVWVGTGGEGLFLLMPSSGTYAPVPLGSATPCSVKALLQDGDSVFVGTSTGLFEFHLSSMRASLRVSHEDVVSLARGPNRSCLAGTRSGRVFQLDGKDARLVCEAPSPISALVLAGDQLWLGTLGAGVYRWTQPGPLEVAPCHAQVSGEILSLLPDLESGLWIGTSHGLFHWEGDGRPCSCYRASAHAPSLDREPAGNSVTCLFRDRRDVMWLGFREGGVSRFDMHRRWFVHYHQGTPEFRLPNSSIRAIQEDAEGNLWLGADVGLFNPRYELPVPEQLRGTWVASLLARRNGTLWAAGEVGLWVLAPPNGHRDRKWTDLPLHAPRNSMVTTLLEDREGNVWAGTTDGLFLYRDDAGWIDDPRLKALRETSISALFQDRSGGVWVGATSGACRIDASGATPLVEWPGGAVTCFAEEPEGRLFIGSEFGLHEWSRAHGLRTPFPSLKSAHVASLVFDEDGGLWISGDFGVARAHLKSGEIRHFDTDDGLQSRIFHPGSAAKGRSGLIYFGGPMGLNVINPKELPEVASPQRPILLSLEFNGAVVTPSPNGILTKPLMSSDSIEIPYHASSRVSFTFASLDYSKPRRSRFRYQLDGFDRAWLDAGPERRAIYTGLSSGEYRLRVQGSIDGLHWHPDEASIRITVLAPWHQRWWARVGLGLSVLIGVGLAVWRGIQSHAARLEREQERMAHNRQRAETELAKRLQAALLAERAANEREQEMDPRRLFQRCLNGLASLFDVARGRLYLVDPGGAWRLAASFPPEDEAEWNVEPILREAAAHDGAVSSTLATLDSDPLPILAARTHYLDQPNGVFLVSDAADRTWKPEEVLLLQNVAAQIGMAVAQTEIFEREGRQRRELEHAKQTAEAANQAKSDFLAKITHELRTPLNAILGYCELLSGDPAITGSQLETLETINSSGEHLLAVINDVLDMAKIEAGWLELNEAECDLRRLLEGLRKMLSFRAEQKSLSLILSLSDNLPRSVRTDVGKIRQVLVNLLGNAIKFTEHGSITLHADRDGSMLRFVVEDTGRGIAPAEQDHLFDMFFQAEAGRQSLQQGTGLGLSICRKFVEFLGGQIHVESHLGLGTKFRFSVPCVEVQGGDASELVSARPRRRKLAPGQDVRILVAEDQPANRMLLSTVLQAAGFQVAAAVNGREAVERWDSFRPHLTFMDLNMPEMNGDEATEAIIRQHWARHPRIVALTASALEETRVRMIGAGCCDFLTKPYTPDRVLEVVASHLGVRYEDREPMALAS